MPFLEAIEFNTHHINFIFAYQCYYILHFISFDLLSFAIILTHQYFSELHSVLLNFQHSSFVGLLHQGKRCLGMSHPSIHFYFWYFFTIIDFILIIYLKITKSFATMNYYFLHFSTCSIVKSDSASLWSN